MIELNTLKKMMKEVRENKDFLDSVSPNQFKSKQVLIKHVEDLQLVDQNSRIVIFGGWYGSILIPAFKYVDKITLIDKDPKRVSEIIYTALQISACLAIVSEPFLPFTHEKLLSILNIELLDDFNSS